MCLLKIRSNTIGYCRLMVNNRYNIIIINYKSVILWYNYWMFLECLTTI